MNMRGSMTPNNDILFEIRGRAGIATLNRPQALNAVTDAMLSALDKQLDAWELSSDVERVMICAVPGRAFSAGGDIRHLYESGLRGDYDFDFFAREYRLNARIAQFSKPYVALVDGIAMGGGVGVSFHGRYRIATENLVFAMPEVGIGFFPDVGASHILPELPGHLGLYLALTGDRVKTNDAMWSGLATHMCPSEKQNDFIDLVCNASDLDSALDQYLAPAGEPGSLQAASAWIDHHFAQPSVIEIVESLENIANGSGSEGSGGEAEWAKSTHKALLQKSPTSLEIAFRQIRSGAALTINECMQMEFRILNRILTGTEFYEGIRAAIIDKDREPHWQPARLQDVKLAAVAAHFAPLGDGELEVT